MMPFSVTHTAPDLGSGATYTAPDLGSVLLILLLVEAQCTVSVQSLVLPAPDLGSILPRTAQFR